MHSRVCRQQQDVTLPLLVTTLIEHTPATVVTAATDVQLGPPTAISMQLTLIQTAFFGGPAPTPTDHSLASGHTGNGFIYQ